MKKIIIVVALIGLVTSPLFAAAITDATQSLGKMKPSLTVEDNYIFSRDIKKDSSRNKFDTDKINQVYGKLGLGVMDGLNLYAKLGASNAGKIKDNNDSSTNNEYETDYGFMWGLGTSYVKEISDGWKLGADAQFNYWNADVSKVKYNNIAASSVSGSVKNYEVQGTPFVTKKFDISSYNWSMNPYLGVKFSYFKTMSDGISYTAGGAKRNGSWTLKGKNYVGIVVGSDLQMNKNTALQIEGRFIDETAITVGGVYKF